MKLNSEIPSWSYAVKELKGLLAIKPEFRLKANLFGDIYKGKRGLMVVDVICSKRRNYEKRVLGDLLPAYIEGSKDLSLSALSVEAPKYLKVMKSEPEIMKQVAISILDFGRKTGLSNEEDICKQWASSETYWLLLNIVGMGPVLLEYLRMLCGVDTIKLDVNVNRALESLDIQTKGFPPDVLLKICETLAEDVGCSLVTLDQALFYMGQNNKRK